MSSSHANENHVRLVENEEVVGIEEMEEDTEVVLLVVGIVEEVHQVVEEDTEVVPLQHEDTEEIHLHHEAQVDTMEHGEKTERDLRVHHEEMMDMLHVHHEEKVVRVDIVGIVMEEDLVLIILMKEEVHMEHKNL